MSILPSALELVRLIHDAAEICEIDEKLQGKNSSSAGLSWNKLGEIRFENKNFVDTGISLEHAVEIREGLRRTLIRRRTMVRLSGSITAIVTVNSAIFCCK